MKIKVLAILFSCMNYNIYGLAYPIDVVIPCHEKDVRTLELAIEGIKSHGKDVRRIMVVSANKLTDKAEWISESLYPFTKKDVALAIFEHDQARVDRYAQAPENRLGWIYQQLLKLYTPLVIPGISPNVLILDADTIFLRPVEFIDNDGNALFNIGIEYVDSYFNHMKRLIPGLHKVYDEHSGICHHMLLQHHIIKDLFQVIKAQHHKEPWRAICDCIDKKDLFACLSEYEMYFNFVFSRHYKAKIRPLRWIDMGFNYGAISARKQQGYDYVSCHSYRN